MGKREQGPAVRGWRSEGVLLSVEAPPHDLLKAPARDGEEHDQEQLRGVKRIRRPEMALLKDQANGWFGNGHHPEGQGDEQGEGPSEGAVQGLVEGREVPLRHQFSQKGIGGHPGRLGHHPHRDEHDPPGIVQPADGSGPRHRAKDPAQLFIQTTPTGPA